MTLFLAVVLLADVAKSIRPMAFIRACLSGVNLPENFWWVLLVIKTLAAAGLIADHWLADAGYAGVGLAATVGVVVYFLCAVVAHIRAHFLGREFWLNCLGMLALSLVTLGFVVL